MWKIEDPPKVPVEEKESIITITTSTSSKAPAPQPVGRVGYLGMSPGFVTDVVRMKIVRSMHKGNFDVTTISEHPQTEGHMCTDFSSARGWNTILEGFFDILCLDYSWMQRDYFYTNYGGKRWYFDPSVPGNKGFIERFFEWNGKVILIPLDERGDVWNEFCRYQHLNNFDYQLLMHESCPLVQATRKAEYTKQWQAVPAEFRCKTDRNQRRYLRSASVKLPQQQGQRVGQPQQYQRQQQQAVKQEQPAGGEDKDKDKDKDKDSKDADLAAQATHIAFLHKSHGMEALRKYINHGKARIRELGRTYIDPTGHTAKIVTAPKLHVLSTQQWVQCDRCSKWRGIPGTVNMEALPEEWDCTLNEWDAERDSCSVPEMVELAQSPPQPQLQPEAQVESSELDDPSPPLVPVLPPSLLDGAVSNIEVESEGIEGPTEGAIISAKGEERGEVVVVVLEENGSSVAIKKEAAPPPELVVYTSDADAEYDDEEDVEGRFEDAIVIPSNFPAPVPPPEPPSLSTSSPRLPKRLPGDGGPSGSGSARKKMKGDGVTPPVVPLVQVTMEQLPPEGTLITESWVQCENRSCHKWHQVGESVMSAVQDKKVTCPLLGLECAVKTAPPVKKTREEQMNILLETWAECAFDNTFMQCIKGGCGRLAYKRDVMKGKACSCV
jgi:hypothetical protein